MRELVTTSKLIQRDGEEILKYQVGPKVSWEKLPKLQPIDSNSDGEPYGSSFAHDEIFDIPTAHCLSLEVLIAMPRC